MSKKISQFTPSTAPTSGDILPVANFAGNSVGIRLKYIKELFQYDAGLNRSPIGMSGHLIVSGGLSVSGDFKVSGHTFIGRSASNILTITGPTQTSGSVTISGALVVTGDLTATGNSILLGNNASSNVYISGRLVSAGSSVFYGNQLASGIVSVNGTFLLSGSGIFGTPQNSSYQNTFYGKTVFNQTGYFSSGVVYSGGMTGDNLYIGGVTELRGASYLYDSASIGSSSTNTLSVAATTTFNAPVLFTSTQITQGDLKLAGNIVTSGTAIFGDQNTDSATFHGVLNSRNLFAAWSGIASSGGITSSGNVLVLGSGIFATGVSINGPFTTSGRNYLGANIGNTTHLQGTGYVSGSLDVRNYLGVSGNIHCGGAIYSNQVKQCMFDPQVKIGITNGMYYDSGAGVQKIRFLFYRQGNGTARVTWPDTGSFQANDIIYCSGVYTNGDPYTDLVQNKLHSAYNGFFIVDSTFANSTDGGMILRPTGIPISPPGSGGVSGGTPYILCHYRSGWLRNVSGIVPIQGSTHLSMGETEVPGSSAGGQRVFHHKIIFPTSQPFSSSDYMALLSCNQGSGQNTEPSITTRLKIANVSYMDQNLPTEKIIYAGLAGSGESRYTLRHYVATEYFSAAPTKVWARFEEI